jgi:type IX secretion system PorP/SprF family membrane protein
MKKILTILLLALAASPALKAQDPEFTQFYANPLYLNPAFAGTAAGPRFAMNFRDQWPSSSGAFVTYAASYDQHFDGIGGGIGAQVWRDQAGDGNLSTTYVSGMYSYHLAVKDNPRDYFIVKMAVQASAFYRSVDFSKFRFPDEFDPKTGWIGPITQENLPSRGYYATGWIPDFGAGILAFTNKYYFGAAVSHLIEPTQSFYGTPWSVLPRKYTLHGGMQLPLDNWKRIPETFLSPNLLIQRQGTFTQVDIGAYFIKDYFVAGAWYRHTDPNADAISFLVGVKKDAVKIGYSYDVTVSGLRSASPGSHEVSLVVEMKKYDHTKTRKWRKIVCPTF